MVDVIRVLSTLALKGAVHSLAGHYEATGGARINADFAPTLALLERLRASEAADIVILTREGLNEIAREGRVVAESCVDLARSYVGIAVKAGASPSGHRNRACAARDAARGPFGGLFADRAAFCLRN
jgi:molybdate transport system substrate-binding protein